MTGVRKRVLYVEDEKFFADTLEKFLSGAGYDVLLAKDGDEGLATARDHMPDIILLDLLLPKSDGFAVLEELKRDLGLQKIPVIVLSNLNSEDDVAKAKKLGAHAFFVKALTMPTAILAAVNETLKNGHA